MDLMQTLNRSAGLTLVIVTHDAGVGAQCNRIVRMHDGEIVGQDAIIVVPTLPVAAATTVA
jgi:putative ABC transport system ATP-binding protein